MLSLYDIEEQLLGVFQDIEDNGGEITPEQEDYLRVTENNFRSKLDKYAKAVKTFEAFIENCKEEEKRIHARRKVYENRIERLKKMMLEAIDMFGTDGKFIETGTFRLTARNIKSVDVNDARVHEFNVFFGDFIHEMATNGMLGVEDNVDFQGMIDVINENIKASYEESEKDCFVPYTLGDLETIKIDITKTATVKDLLERYTSYLYAYGTDNFGSMKPEVSKTDAKFNIESLGMDSSVATIKENKSLMIK